MRALFRFVPGILITAVMAGSAPLSANELEIVNVKRDQSAPGGHVTVQFDVSWKNSWRTDLPGSGAGVPHNYDAVWVFIKYSADGGDSWQHASLSTDSSNFSISVHNGTAGAFRAAPDGKGVFLFRAQNGTGTVDWEGVMLVWDASADGVHTLDDAVLVNVLALEMVYVPAGAFVAGDDGGSFAALQRGSANASGWEISGEDALNVTGTSSGPYYYVSAGNDDSRSNEDPTGSSFTVPGAYPKGFNAFFMMKYEVTQGQYADFLNLLSPEEAAARDITAEPGYGAFRSTITGTHPFFEAGVPSRASNFLSVMDGLAYADWAGLRPASELEFEKAARGPLAPTPGEYAWGDTQITAAQTLSGEQDGTETVTDTDANCVFDEVMFTGGAGGSGPLRPGIFAAGVSTATDTADARRLAGASFYGVMELSGNLWERTVTLGSARGRGFEGSHGDGHLTTESAYPGNATNSDWPGFDSRPERGVTSAGGSGLRGGGWTDGAHFQRVSARDFAALYEKRRLRDTGFRAIRTDPAAE